jgi:hypothetical protein
MAYGLGCCDCTRDSIESVLVLSQETDSSGPLDTTDFDFPDPVPDGIRELQVAQVTDPDTETLTTLPGVITWDDTNEQVVVEYGGNTYNKMGIAAFSGGWKTDVKTQAWRKMRIRGNVSGVILYYDSGAISPPSDYPTPSSYAAGSASDEVPLDITCPDPSGSASLDLYSCAVFIPYLDYGDLTFPIDVDEIYAYGSV